MLEQNWRKENGVEVGAGFYRNVEGDVTILDPNTQRLWDGYLFTRNGEQVEIQDILHNTLTQFPLNYVGEPRFVEDGVVLRLENGAEIVLGTQNAKYPTIRATGDTSIVDYNGNLFAAVEGELRLKNISGYVRLFGDGMLKAGTIYGDAWIYDCSTLKAGAINGIVSSRGESTLAVETINGHAWSHDSSTLKAGAINGYAWSLDSSTLKVETVEGNVDSSGKSTLIVKTVKRDAWSHDSSTLKAGTIGRNAYSYDRSTLAADTVAGDMLGYG